MFSKLFDIKSLEEWEASCRNLKEKLQEDLKADFDDYQTAKGLYEQWEQLFKESNANIKKAPCKRCFFYPFERVGIISALDKMPR